MLGRQKSGCELGMMKITSSKFSECEYDINDPIIKKAVTSKAKGGCVELYITPKQEKTLFDGDT